MLFTQWCLIKEQLGKVLKIVNLKKLSLKRTSVLQDPLTECKVENITIAASESTLWWQKLLKDYFLITSFNVQASKSKPESCLVIYIHLKSIWTMKSWIKYLSVKVLMISFMSMNTSNNFFAEAAMARQLSSGCSTLTEFGFCFNSLLQLGRMALNFTFYP